MGGFIAESVGVQYVFYVIIVICGVVAVLGISLLRETYAPVIRLRRDKIMLDPEILATAHPTLTPHNMDGWAYIWINLQRPFIIFTRSFICFILGLYMSL
jgi:hypothetical protein